MNKHILTIALTGLALASFSQAVSAHEEDEDNQRPDYQQSYDPRSDGRQQVGQRGGGLNYEVDHLNQMVAHVQGQLRRYGADRHILGEYQHIRDETYRISNQFRRGEQYYNRRRLRGEIEHMHSELHHIEQELHVPANQFFQWR